jgi:hypothetical protein
VKVSFATSAAALLTIVLVCIGLSLHYELEIGYAPDEGNHMLMVEHHSRSLALAAHEDWRYGAYRGHAYHLFSPVPYVAFVPFYLIQQRFGRGPR